MCRRRKGGVGKSSFLTPAQQKQLAAAAQAVWDGIEDRFGVVYRVGSLYTVLSRLGIRLKTPRPRHTQAALQA